MPLFLPEDAERMEGDGELRWRREKTREKMDKVVRESKGANSVREGDRRRWPLRRRRRSKDNQREMRDGGRSLKWWVGEARVCY